MREIYKNCWSVCFPKDSNNKPLVIISFLFLDLRKLFKRSIFASIQIFMLKNSLTEAESHHHERKHDQ